MLPNVAEHGIGYPNLFYFFTNLMIYLLLASGCAENYPPAGASVTWSSRLNTSSQR
jgi:hypothetical protein